MKNDRMTDITNLVSNLRLILQDDKEKFIAFTTDSTKLDLNAFVGELASVFSEDRKVAIASYVEVDNKVDDIEYVLIDAKNDTRDDILSKTEPYDLVIVICPSLIVSKSYLHMAKFVKDMVIVAKKWNSKTANIKTMRDVAKDIDINVLGLVYQK